MLIQNIGNTVQAPQPVRLTSDSGLGAVVTAPPNTAAKPSTAPELPQAALEQQVPAEQIRSAVENINQALKQSNRNLEFSIDESTNKQVFKLKDAETGDVIRQYPTEEMLAVSRAIGQIQQGLLLKQEA